MEHEQGPRPVTREALVDATGIAVATKVTNAGAGASVVSWALSSEFGVLAGIFLAIAGYLTNLWFQHRRDKREAEAHAKYMAQTKPGALQ